MITQPYNPYAWWGFEYTPEFSETYWSGDPDPNYLLYVTSNYSNSWNEWGTPIYDPQGWNNSMHYYDYCYNKQAQALDKTERIKWVNECEKYMFLNGAAHLTTCNPKSCYGYVDLRWTDWGNWTEHPGLSIENYWGETLILLKVKWVSEGGDNTVIIVGLSSSSILIATIAAIEVIRGRKQVRKVPEDYDNDVTRNKE